MPENTITRRGFLKAAGTAIGGTALVCAGVGCAAAQPSQDPQTQTKAQVETPTFQYGKENDMNKRILVTYATRAGSTVDVAAAIGETIAARGFAVDVKPVNDNPSLDGYQAVVMGSAINGAQWLPEAVEFVHNHQDALNRVPVALFCVHIMNLGDDEKARSNRLGYLDKVRSMLQPANEAFFAGVSGDGSEPSWIMRLVCRTFKVGEGDLRDWDKIRGWAETVLA